MSVSSEAGMTQMGGSTKNFEGGDVTTTGRKASVLVSVCPNLLQLLFKSSCIKMIPMQINSLAGFNSTLI